MGIARQRAWATMDKARLVLGDYGHKTPAGLGYHGQNPLGFGLPWAKFTWVRAMMGTKHPRVWATMGKIRSVLGYHGQSLLGFGFGRLWAQNAAGLGYHGQSLSGFGRLRARPFITAGLCDGGSL